MLDFTKIKFNEIDNVSMPPQIFYEYNLSQNEIDKFLEEYATCEEFSKDISIRKIELCLIIYSRHDFKLEAYCTSVNNELYWVEINKQFTNADEFIQLIPVDVKQKIKWEEENHEYV